MFRMITMLAYFFRELVFDSKEEYDFRSRRFNGRKVLIFVLMCGSFLSNIVFTDRIYKLALENTHLRTELNIIKQNFTSAPPSDSGKLTTNSLPPKPK